MIESKNMCLGVSRNLPSLGNSLHKTSMIKKMQMKIIKPVPKMSSYSFRLRMVYFPSKKKKVMLVVQINLSIQPKPVEEAGIAN